MFRKSLTPGSLPILDSCAELTSFLPAALEATMSHMFGKGEVPAQRGDPSAQTHELAIEPVRTLTVSCMVSMCHQNCGMSNPLLYSASGETETPLGPKTVPVCAPPCAPGSRTQSMRVGSQLVPL